MTVDLSARVAIVTGASRGIGRGIATALARAGASVVLCARGDHAQSTADVVSAEGGKALALACDVTDPGAVQGMVARAVEHFGRVDILVNNAGITRDQLLLRMKREDWDEVLATNLTAAFTCSQAVLRHMTKQRWGRIVMIGSVVGQSGNAGQVNYAASKAGLVGFAKALAREVGSRQVTVNVVAPGYIETDMTQALSDDARQAWVSGIPLGRFGTAEDVAAAVCYLASDAAGYVTGQVLAVNGGMYT